MEMLLQGSLALSQAGNVVALAVLIVEFVDELTEVSSCPALLAVSIGMLLQ